MCAADITSLKKLEPCPFDNFMHILELSTQNKTDVVDSEQKL